RPAAAHPPPADQHVYLRVFQHVPDVDRAGDVRRGQRDREPRPVRGILRPEELLLEPGIRPALLDLLRFVSLRYFAGHALPFRRADVQLSRRIYHYIRRPHLASNRRSDEPAEARIGMAEASAFSLLKNPLLVTRGNGMKRMKRAARQ